MGETSSNSHLLALPHDPHGPGECDEDVDWLECISAIETEQGLLYFCNAAYGSGNPDLSVTAEFRSEFEEGTHLYSITAYNPLNKVTNRVVNEVANHRLLSDLKSLLPGCKVYRNFSYFQNRPYHFERGYTIQIPGDYPIRNHGMIVYSLAIKYRQAAFFKGVVVQNGLTVPYIILVQGEYTEVKEKLVTIKHGTVHPAFLHKANHAVFRDLTQVLDLLYQTREHIDLCDELYQLCLDNFQPASVTEERHPIVAMEGLYSREAADKVSQLLGAEFCGNTPQCLASLQHKYKHSVVLQAAFKTIADYIQAAEIARKAQAGPVVVHKFWSNTTASLIASEIGKGSSNIPPRNHEIYHWPEGLLKPDAVILLKGRPSGKTDQIERLKLKMTALKRMADEHWIPVNIQNIKHLDHLSSLIMDKLSLQGIARLSAPVDPLCPASDVAPQQTVYLSYDGLQQEATCGLVSAKVDDSVAGGKPFWW